MIILGLTGSMGMGKSTLTRMLRLVYQVPVFDADQAVRDLWASDPELIQEISKRFPQAIEGGKIDREKLRTIAFNDDRCLNTLEDLVIERALSECHQFLNKMHRLKVPFCVLDVPLLFEVGWDRWCTHTVVVYAPSFIQRQRLKKRPHLTEKNIHLLLKRYGSLKEKKARATYQIQTGLSKGHTFRQLSRIMKDIKSRQVHHA